MSETVAKFHSLSDKWVFWAHLPHDTDWTMSSYKTLLTVSSVEEMIAILDCLPDTLVKNCMLFMMRDGIKPMWEDKSNLNGGCFSYKITNNNVKQVWDDLCCMVSGNSISKEHSFIEKITGITISPKKSFCIIKIWMKDCTEQNVRKIRDIKNLSSHGCLFKKHLNNS